MTQRRTSTVGTRGRGNRSLLLHTLHVSAPSGRHGLAAATGLSAASVGDVVRELVDEGVVIEVGSVDSDNTVQDSIVAADYGGGNGVAPPGRRAVVRAYLAPPAVVHMLPAIPSPTATVSTRTPAVTVTRDRRPREP